MGVSLFELMSGDLPFFGQGGGMLLRGAEIPAIQGHFSEELKKTVQSCLARETWDRPTAEQLRDYAEAKLQGRKPVKAWGEPSGSAKAKDGTTGKPEEGKVEPPVTPKVEVAAETARQGRGKGRRNRTGVLVAVVLVVIAVLTSVAVFVQQSNRREKAERERLIAMAERARQDSIADAQAEMQRQAREAEERRQAEEARQKAERERQAAEAKAEQERLAQQERQRQEQERQRQVAEARRKATSNRTIRVGDVSFEMVYVEGGTFRMGATVEQGSDAVDDEKPVHGQLSGGESQLGGLPAVHRAAEQQDGLEVPFADRGGMGIRGVGRMEEPGLQV